MENANLNPECQGLKESERGISLVDIGCIFLPKRILEKNNCSYLLLKNNKLKEYPKELEKVDGLYNLGIINNLLISIPDEISLLKNLIILKLDGNKINYISPMIGTLENLHSLSLVNNEITDIPKEIANLKNLKFISLRRNKIKRLPIEIADMDDLLDLDLRINPIDKKDSPTYFGSISLKSKLRQKVILDDMKDLTGLIMAYNEKNLVVALIFICLCILTIIAVKILERKPFT